MLRFLLFTCCCIAISLTHNINTKIGPIFKTHTAASYFGFSATGVIDEVRGGAWVAVGSPRANTSELNSRSQKFDDKNTGALYKCPINMDPSNCVDITTKVQQAPGESYNPSNGWYGVSVGGGRKGDDKVMVCSHRPLVRYCTPLGNDCADSLPGMCLILSKEDGTYDDEILTVSNSNDYDFSGGGASHITMSYERSRFGETGVAAEVQGDIFYASAVGDIAWTGSIVTKDSKQAVTDQKYSYGGYSFTTGSFFSAGSKEFAIGAPRYNVTGAVFVKDSLTDPPKKIIPGKQYGSYFGMAICAADFDGDGFSEIVVGAPYYTDSVGSPSIGEVYVYKNKDNFSSPVWTYRAPKPQARALFGKAVAVIGDLDRSGYNDLIIGSPYEGKGGVVYIYHGSSTGLSQKPVQIIRASDFPNDLKTFGWSIRGETDLDGNGYPDIVIGAYASDSIVILRPVPVVKVDIEYKLSSSTIDVSNKTCSIMDKTLGKIIQTVCFEVEVDASYMDRAGKMKNPINISFELDADTLEENPKKKRVRFVTSESPSLVVKNKLVLEGVKTAIFKAKAYLRVDQCPDCEDKISPFPDIQLQVVPKVPKDRQAPPSPAQSGNAPSLQPYFVLPYSTGDDDVKNYTETKILVKRACDPCKPNLMIENNGTTKIPVQAKDIHVKVKVSNIADQAYGVVLTINIPSPLRFRLCDKDIECLFVQCVIFNETRMTCDIGTLAQIPKIYTIKLDTSEASNSLQTYLVTFNVTSKSAEDPSLLGDNFLPLELTVASEANIFMSSESKPSARFYGGSVRGQFSMTNEDQIGLKVTHVYTVNNAGPDSVPEVNITIEWPYQAKNGKRLLYLLNITGEDIDLGKATCFPEPGWVNPLASQFKDDSNRVRRNVDDSDEETAASAVTPTPARKGSASTIVLDCANGTAMCFLIPCTLKNIDKSTSVAVVLESRIWNSTLLEDYTDRDVQVVSRGRIDDLTSYVTDPIAEDHEKKTITSFFPDSPKTIKKDIAVWIIVVSAIAGVVLLIILVVVFKMCGFFNRSGAQRYDAVPEN